MSQHGALKVEPDILAERARRRLLLIFVCSSRPKAANPIGEISQMANVLHC